MRSLAPITVVCFCAIVALVPCVDAAAATRRGETFPLPEDEAVALEEMKSLVTEGDIETAKWLAASFHRLAGTEGHALTHVSLWAELAADLHQCTPYPVRDVHDIRRHARAAAALGLHDVAIRCYRTSLRKGQDRGRASDAKEAAMAALRKGDYGRAIEFFCLVEKHGTAWVKELGAKRAEQVRQFARAPRDVDVRLKFAAEALGGPDPAAFQYFDDGIALLVETCELDPPPALEQRKKVHLLLEDFHRRKNDPAGAEEWAMRTVRSFPEDRELCAAALVRIGTDTYEQNNKARALALFRRASDEYAGTESWPDAQFNVGYILAERGKYRDAIAAFEKVLAAKVDNLAGTGDIMAPLKNYQHRSCAQIALAHEALGDYGSALKYLGTTHGFETFCGTCAASEQESRRQHEALLKALDALGESTDDEIARVAGDFLRRHNGHATRVLVRLGPKATHTLAGLMADTDAGVRRLAVHALLELGPDAAEAVPTLAELIGTDPDKAIRGAAARCLGRIGAPARPAVPSLLEALQDRSSGIAQHIRPALVDIGPTREDLPSLLAALEKGDRHVGALIMPVIQSMGSKAADAVPLLIRLGRDENLYLDSQAMAALAAIGEPAVTPVLRTLAVVSTNDYHAYRFLLNTLHRLGPHAEEAIPEFVDVVRRRKLSGELLGPVGEAALPTLKELLSDEDECLRATAALALGGMGQPAVGAVSLLVRMADEDEKGYPRVGALRALGMLAPHSPDATALLVRKLGSSNGTERIAATEAFREIWPGAVEALPALERLRSDSARSARRAAQTAVGRLKAMQRIMACRAGRARDVE